LPEPATVQLVTRTEVPSAEILVLDSRFQFVVRGVGALSVPLAPGAYIVQYKAGSTVVEVPVVLRPDAGSVTLPAPALTMGSPCPLAGTDAGTLYGEFARQCSRDVHERVGTGGELFVFVRSARADRTRAATQDSLFDISIHDGRATRIVELARSGKRSLDGLSLGCTVELAPGTYFLRYPAGDDGFLEQAFVVSEDWQTQVFASSRPFRAGSDVLGPNFPDAAVFMAARGVGFDPGDSAALRAEAARQGLAESRRVGAEDQIRSALDQVRDIRRTAGDTNIRELLRLKFGNPMLGIYGLHLMLLNPGRPWDLLREVITNLKDLVGEHPDAMVCTVFPELRDIAPGMTFGAPPMLRNSWKLLVDGSTARPELVPTSSYAAGIAARTWGSGAWLVWRPPAEAPGVVPAAAPRREDVTLKDIGVAILRMQKHVLEEIRALGVGPYVAKVAQDKRLTDPERTILMYAIATTYQGTRLLSESLPQSGPLSRVATFVTDKLKEFKSADWLTGGLTLAPILLAHFGSDHLVRALGLPLATLNQAIVSLADKLGPDAP
jgi:hypothetical protein